MKIVLAYSGGLDTSIIIAWLKEKYNAEIITYTANLGQDEDLSGIKEKALKTGATEAIVEDITNEFVNDYVFPLLRSGAKYENTYLNGTISRPLIAKKLVEIAEKYKADAICHGATGKGNDQVRFEASIFSLNPKLKVIAPWRDWEFTSREELMDFAKSHGIEVEATKKSPYSIDRNIFYVSHEGGVLEDCKNEFPKDVLKMTQHPEDASNEPENIKISFEKGNPVAINDKKMNSVEIMKQLNIIGHKHGIGLIDIVEDRMVGMKSRGTYEFPAGEIIYQAHQKLETITLTKEVLIYKQKMSVDYANLVYSAGWFTQLKQCMDEFINKTQENVSGYVVLKLYKGNIFSVSLSSPYSLYNPELAGFKMGEEYNQKDAEGFIKIFSIPMKVFGKVNKK